MRLLVAAALTAALLAGCKASVAKHPPLREMDIQGLLADSKGKTVRIPRGTYVFKESLNFECDDTTLLCEPGTWLLVEDVSNCVLSIHDVANARIENAHLAHVKPLEEYACHGAVVDVKNAKGVVISNCELNGCGAVGVRATGTKNLLVEHCWVRNNTFNAFYFDECEQINLRANVIENNANCFQMYRVTDIQASDNLIRDNGGYWSEKGAKPGMKPE